MAVDSYFLPVQKIRILTDLLLKYTDSQKI